MAFPVALSASVGPGQLLTVLQADLEMALPPPTSTEPLVLPAVSLRAIRCRLNTELLVLLTGRCRLLPQADLGAPTLCQHSTVLRHVPAHSTARAHSTPLAVDTLPQEAETMPKKMILLYVHNTRFSYPSVALYSH
jgi:hypothetical protein